MKNISFLSENFQFLEVKLYIYLNRHVFVMIFTLLIIIIHWVAPSATLASRNVRTTKAQSSLRLAHRMISLRKHAYSNILKIL